MTTDKLIINSEDEALELLARVLRGEEKLDIRNIEFGDWAKLKIRLTGDEFHSSINATVMKGLLALQDGIYQSYAIAKDMDSTRFLTQQERSDLEIDIEVSEGSSILGVDLQQLGEKYITSTVDKMPAEYILVVFIMFGLGWAGNKAWATYIQAKSNEKIKELEDAAKLDEQKQNMLHQLEVMKEANSNALEHAKINQENMKMFTQAVAMNPKLKQISEVVEDSKETMIRAMANSGAETVEFQGISLETSVAKELVTTPKNKWLPSRLDGVYQIINIDYSNTEAYRIKLKDTSSDFEITAIFEDLTSNNENIDLLTTVANSRLPIRVNLNVSKFGDSYKDATIVSIASLEEKISE